MFHTKMMYHHEAIEWGSHLLQSGWNNSTHNWLVCGSLSLKIYFKAKENLYFILCFHCKVVQDHFAKFFMFNKSNDKLNNSIFWILKSSFIITPQMNETNCLILIFLMHAWLGYECTKTLQMDHEDFSCGTFITYCLIVTLSCICCEKICSPTLFHIYHTFLILPCAPECVWLGCFLSNVCCDIVKVCEDSIHNKESLFAMDHVLQCLHENGISKLHDCQE